MRTFLQRFVVGVMCACAVIALCPAQDAVQPRVIELTAGKDSRYRMGKTVSPTIEVAAGEHLVLRITATKAKEVARDGSIHGLALLDKDQNAIPGWSFYLHPGAQDLAVVAPMKPGRYAAVCTIICSDMHDGMGFTLVVTQTSSNIGAKQ